MLSVGATEDLGEIKSTTFGGISFGIILHHNLPDHEEVEISKTNTFKTQKLPSTQHAKGNSGIPWPS